MYLWGDNLKVLPSIKDNAVDLILTDPPYALTSTRVYPKDTKLSEISDNLKEQVAKNTYYGATLRGFMGREWDGKLPEVQTWLECFRVLKPGGFILVMASPRNDDLVSVSLREAGFVKHNSIYWVYGSGFPKGSDCSKMLDAQAVRAWLSQHDHGLTPKEISKVVSAAVNGEYSDPKMNKGPCGGTFNAEGGGGLYTRDKSAGARLISQLEEKYGSMPKRVKVGEYEEPSGRKKINEPNILNEPETWRENANLKECETKYIITAPATPLAKEFKGMKYGIQALKPAAEVILVFQKPFDGSPLENILKWRVGCINVDEGRIGINKGDDIAAKNPHTIRKTYKGAACINVGESGEPYDYSKGRYPSNFLLSHSPGCRVVGERRVKVKDGPPDRFKNADGGGFSKSYGNQIVNTAVANGKETVRQYECEENCAVRELDRQSGERKGGGAVIEHNRSTVKGFASEKALEFRGMNDTGTASRFFYQPEWGPADFRYVAKASSAERGAGCEDIFWEKVGREMVRIDRKRYLELAEEDRGQGNNHPTCKPISLAQYLIKLYRGNNPNSVILDPFAGSGWVEIACILEDCKSLSIEAEWEYCIIGETRSVYWKANKSTYLTEGKLPKYRAELPLFEEE